MIIGGGFYISYLASYKSIGEPIYTDNFEKRKNDILKSNSINVDIYPNPNKGYIEIKLSGNTDDYFSLDITDIKGNIIYKKNNIKSNCIVDISTQPKGIYFIKASVGYDVFIRKIIYQ